jgi:hypothetical protein
MEIYFFIVVDRDTFFITLEKDFFITCTPGFILFPVVKNSFKLAEKDFCITFGQGLFLMTYGQGLSSIIYGQGLFRAGNYSF